jgi:hypothetical protein
VLHTLRCVSFTLEIREAQTLTCRNVVTVIIGRLLIGYAVGTITGVAPVFGAEIAKVNTALPGQPGSWFQTTVMLMVVRPMSAPESRLSTK